MLKPFPLSMATNVLFAKCMSIILQDGIMKTRIEKSELSIKDGTVTYIFLHRRHLISRKKLSYCHRTTSYII